MSDIFHILGKPAAGGVLIVGDHASNHIPDDIGIDLSGEDRQKHVAWDIGVCEVSEILVKKPQFSAFLAGTSRLVLDLNRYEDEEALIPVSTDGITIAGNMISPKQRAERIARFYQPYHQALSDLVAEKRPALIVALHSFTDKLASRPDEQRPWQAGVMYNEHYPTPKLAIKLLRESGLIVGDQQPYSGKLLNATMNKHAEAHDIPYFGCEMRQDLVCDAAGQARFAEALTKTCLNITEMLGAGAENE